MYQKGRELFSPQDQNLVTRAIGISLFPEYMERLCLTLTYLHTFHADKIDLWMQSFIGDSITAYQHSSNSLSCTKGVYERILTGLRVLDDEDLNAIFAQSEGNVLFANKLQLFNFADETMRASRMAELTALGLTNTSSPEEIQSFVQQIIDSAFQGTVLTAEQNTALQEIINLWVNRLSE